jgi:hypothetical protein
MPLVEEKTRMKVPTIERMASDTAVQRRPMRSASKPAIREPKAWPRLVMDVQSDVQMDGRYMDPVA